MFKKIGFLMALAVIFFSAPAYASRVTHLLGTTGYMIQEAMSVHANKKDPENYWKAVQLQKAAKQAFRGTRKGGRNLEEAVTLAREAYGYAKMARDNSKSWPYATSKNNFDKSAEK